MLRLFFICDITITYKEKLYIIIYIVMEQKSAAISRPGSFPNTRAAFGAFSGFRSADFGRITAMSRVTAILYSSIGTLQTAPPALRTANPTTPESWKRLRTAEFTSLRATPAMSAARTAIPSVTMRF